MATPKKKHLIELMIEAGVEWPEGAEYAAQSKCDNKVHFFKIKPKVLTGDEHFCAPGGAMGGSCLLPSLCGNWHQTIVTREQHAEAVAAAGNGEQEQQSHSGVAGVMPSESIESLLAEIKAKREECDALVEKAEALALEIASIEQQVNDKLKGYGFSMSPVAASSEPKQPIITDWRDLLVGDVVEYLAGTRKDYVGKTCAVLKTDEKDPMFRVMVEFDDGNQFWCSEWRFIHRP